MGHFIRDLIKCGYLFQSIFHNLKKNLSQLGPKPSRPQSTRTHTISASNQLGLKLTRPQFVFTSSFFTIVQGFPNFFPGDPNVSIKILCDPKQKKILIYQSYKRGKLVELHRIYRHFGLFWLFWILVVQNSFVVV